MRLTRAILPVVRTTATAAAPSPNAALRVGDTVRERRRFTDADVAAYAAVSGDRNPVHLDDAVARDVGGFQRGRVVHGMLVASVFPSIIAAHFVRSPAGRPPLSSLWHSVEHHMSMTTNS
jgi:acyl dehydratase